MVIALCKTSQTHCLTGTSKCTTTSVASASVFHYVTAFVDTCNKHVDFNETITEPTCCEQIPELGDLHPLPHWHFLHSFSNNEFDGC